MKERLLEFLRSENKSSAQFAEEIGVQPSGISHILSGRNNPSLDFILKMLGKYEFISTDWLLFGKGSMYKDQRMRSLFDEPVAQSQNAAPELINIEAKKPDIERTDTGNSDPQIKNFSHQVSDKEVAVERIVWFYNNGSFDEYFPRH